MKFKEYRDYNIAFIEVILERIKHKVDVDLNAANYDYFLDKSYKTVYMKYCMPGNAECDILVKVFNSFKNDQYLLLPLPFCTSDLKTIKDEDAFNFLIENLHPDIALNIIEDKKYYMEKMGSDHENCFPLLFENNSTLMDFFSFGGEEKDLYFIGNILLVPLSMDWFMLFDYDLEVTHFSFGPTMKKLAGSNEYMIKLIYSDREKQKLFDQGNQ